jgi:hypothetical protein
MIYGLIADFRAGGSTNHITATDGSIVYYTESDGKTYYCNDSSAGKTITMNGQTYTIKSSDLLTYKIRGDIDALEDAVHNIGCCEQLDNLILGALEDVWNKLDGEKYANGDLQIMWCEAYPERYSDEPATPGCNADTVQDPDLVVYIAAELEKILVKTRECIAMVSG